MSSDEVRYFIQSGGDLRRARQLLDAAKIPYREEPWQPGIKAITVPADADVSKVFEHAFREVT